MHHFAPFLGHSLRAADAVVGYLALYFSLEDLRESSALVAGLLLAFGMLLVVGTLLIDMTHAGEHLLRFIDAYPSGRRHALYVAFGSVGFISIFTLVFVVWVTLALG